jgi:hypothetical protein
MRVSSQLSVSNAAVIACGAVVNCQRSTGSCQQHWPNVRQVTGGAINTVMVLNSIRWGSGRRVLYFTLGTIGRMVAWGFVLCEESPGSTGQAAR